MSAAGGATIAAAVCADCGTPAPSRHCPACGQKTTLDSSLGAMISSLLHDLSHVDGKFFRTLPMLAFRPGLLTRRYIDGQRTRYVGPSVIFLSSAFLMFLSFNLLPASPPPPACDSTSALHRAGTAVRKDLQELGPAVGSILPPTSPTGLPASVQWIERHASADIRAKAEASLRNPEVALMKVKQKAYKLGFLLIPLSFPALWLLVGLRPGVRSYDLVVFSLYSVGIMSLLLTVVMLLAGTGLFAWPLYTTLLLGVPPVHFFVHLRGTFALSNADALWRTAVLCVVATLSLVAFLMLVLVWGILI
ncbi:DUF3667 domain-containing protein [Sandaracinobacter neustonicus]|uniref:DUF3667 domain-containing protein n=1 Tax=Sandaracinobacter neustonicus TaxID=1715348 RepID=A0A501XT08_9SPHN|nr:DUF3667 domain-containing protein [Sandaracinobacter neustonicus]TPE63710.1 DUF3667 domain-containing protein [Sandaracinobacter neustonicus]